MNYLLDTCALSEVRKQTANEGLVRWIRRTDESRMFLSAVSLGEIQKGIAKLEKGKRREVLQAWLEQDLSARFAGRILAVDAETALCWGVLLGEAERLGEPLPVVDALIAATATRHSLAIVTRNTRDFERIRVQVLNPWVP